MDATSLLILNLWNNLGEFISTVKKEDAAVALVGAFEEYSESDPSTIVNDLRGEDRYLDNALELVFPEEFDEEDILDEEIDYDE